MLTKIEELKKTILESNNLIAFIGSGLSTNYWSWSDFISNLCTYADYQDGVNFFKKLDKNSNVDIDSYLFIANNAKKELSETEIRSFIASQFSLSSSIPSVYNAIVQSPFKFYITTNYDTNIEDAYNLVHGKTLEVVLPSDAYRIFNFIRDNQPFVFKIHGCAKLGRDMIISYDDYLRIIYLNRKFRYILSSILAMNDVLYLGYGHQDPNINRYLEFEKMIFDEGGMKRYTFVKKDDFPFTLKSRLFSSGISFIKISNWDEIENILKQLTFTRYTVRYSKYNLISRSHFAEFVKNPQKETIWAMLMYISTGSNINQAEDVKEIFKIIDTNEIFKRYIFDDSTLNLIYKILKAQDFKRHNQPELADEVYQNVIEVCDLDNSILLPLKAVSYRYAGMFYLYPAYPYDCPIQNLDKAKELLKKALKIIGEFSLEENLNIRKWLQIINGELGDRINAYKHLLDLADENDKIGLLKASAWCRFGALNQLYEGKLIKPENSNKVNQIINQTFNTFLSIEHSFGIGSVYLLKAKIKFQLEGLNSRNKTEILNYIQQSLARSIIINDKRLFNESESFKLSIKL
jgi:hypothetical protein